MVNVLAENAGSLPFPLQRDAMHRCLRVITTVQQSSLNTKSLREYVLKIVAQQYHHICKFAQPIVRAEHNLAQFNRGQSNSENLA